ELAVVPVQQRLRRNQHGAGQLQAQRNPCRLAALSACVGAALALAASTARTAQQTQTLKTVGDRLELDGRPTTLLGVSVFDALGPTPPGDEDLDALKGWGVNLVRVWAHWREPIYQREGSLSSPGRARLLDLAARLQSRGLTFELVLLRPGQMSGQRYAVFASEEARLRAVGEIASALREYRNVIFDLCNEHDHGDGPISHAAARVLRDRVKTVDPGRLVTISSTATHVMSPAGRIGDEEAKSLRAE